MSASVNRGLAVDHSSLSGSVLCCLHHFLQLYLKTVVHVSDSKSIFQVFVARSLPLWPCAYRIVLLRSSVSLSVPVQVSRSVLIGHSCNFKSGENILSSARNWSTIVLPERSRSHWPTEFSNRRRFHYYYWQEVSNGDVSVVWLWAFSNAATLVS